MAQSEEVLVGNIKKLEGWLAECYKLTGEDPDGNEDWRLSPHAVEAVRELREYTDKTIAVLERKLASLDWSRTDEGNLPEHGVDVLFYVPSCYGIEKGRLYDGKWVSDRTSPQNDEVSWLNRDGQVTHWQPLPNPPEHPAPETGK